MIGQTLGHRYTIEGLLGQGGMGSVYAARHNGTGRRVAVKVIAASGHPAVRARVEIEARASGAIESQHVSQILDVGEDRERGVQFLVMELHVGSDLSFLFVELGLLPVELVLRIGAQACLGLQRAHALGIVHRDIKPANLFLAERDNSERAIKILDFGLAKMELPRAPGSSITRVGGLIGSPRYMSPEQARGERTLDRRTDLWSLGVVLYEALTGRTPSEDAGGLGDVLVSICQDPAAPVSDLAPWVPPEVARVVEKALRIDPAERFQTAAEMLHALRALLPNGFGIHASMLAPAAEAAHRPPRSVQEIDVETTLIQATPDTLDDDLWTQDAPSNHAFALVAR